MLGETTVEDEAPPPVSIRSNLAPAIVSRRQTTALSMDNATFEIIWHSARHNVFSWTTHGVGLCSVLLFFVSGFKGRPIGGKGMLVACLTVVFIVLTALTSASIARKWQIRAQAAHTEEQRMAVARRDGA